MIQIPTTQEIYDDLVASIESALNITIPTSGKSNLRALAQVQAAKLKLYYLAVMKVQKNIFVDTAESEANGGTLERFGRVKLGRSPFSATAGIYQLYVSGTPGAEIPSGTVFRSDDDALSPGKRFALDAAVILSGSTDTITVRALETGLDSQLSPGDTLSLTVPIPEIDQEATVYLELDEPVAAESLEDYRTKTINAFRLEPQGGSPADYRLWAADAQGVAQSYPYAKAGNANQIDLYVEATTADSIDGKGTPTVSILLDVENAIELPTDDRPSRKPLGVFQVNYLPVDVKDLIITINSYVGLTAAKQADILSVITDFINSIRPFIGGIDTLDNQNDYIDGNLIVGKILEAVPGSTFGSITLNIGGIDVSDYTFNNGEIPYLSSILYA